LYVSAYDEGDARIAAVKPPRAKIAFFTVTLPSIFPKLDAMMQLSELSAILNRKFHIFWGKLCSVAEYKKRRVVVTTSPSLVVRPLRARHDGSGGRPGKVVLLTQPRGCQQPAGAADRVVEG
jgi:hypothetical protein